MQTIYGVSGERRLVEHEIPWLSGYENSRPVRVGNAASNQFQLDVYGEVLAAVWQGASCRNQNDRARLVAHGRDNEIPGVALAGAGRRNLGSPRRPPAVYPLKNDGLAGIRSRDQVGREIAAARHTSTSIAGKKFAIKFTHEVCERGYNREEKSFHAGLWVRCAGREPAYNAACRFSAGH